MAKVDVFLECLVQYDKENIHPDVIKAIQPYLKDVEFEPGNMKLCHFICFQLSSTIKIVFFF